jgi:hypothetical protein
LAVDPAVSQRQGADHSALGLLQAPFWGAGLLFLANGLRLDPPSWSNSLLTADRMPSEAGSPATRHLLPLNQAKTHKVPRMLVVEAGSVLVGINSCLPQSAR